MTPEELRQHLSLHDIAFLAGPLADTLENYLFVHDINPALTQEIPFHILFQPPRGDDKVFPCRMHGGDTVLGPRLQEAKLTCEHTSRPYMVVCIPCAARHLRSLAPIALSE